MPQHHIKHRRRTHFSEMEHNIFVVVKHNNYLMGENKRNITKIILIVFTFLCHGSCVSMCFHNKNFPQRQYDRKLVT